MRDNLALAERIDRLEADPAISLGSVDLTIAHPERLRSEFAEVFHYFALVEGEVAQNAADVVAMLPGLDDDDLRFLSAWSVHEAAHSTIFDAIRTELDLTSSAPTTPAQARKSFRGVGVLAEVHWLHDILKLVYLARGAMHEHLTYDAYVHLGARLAALGETGLARTVTDPIRRQEACHLGYYRAAAAAQRRRMSPTQLRWARVISVRTYTPVGATGPRTALCGRVFAKLAGEDIDRVLEPVEAIARVLLADGRHSLPRFVHRAMARCLGDGADTAALTGP